MLVGSFVLSHNKLELGSDPNLIGDNADRTGFAPSAALGANPVRSALSPIKFGSDPNSRAVLTKARRVYKSRKTTESFSNARALHPTNTPSGSGRRSRLRRRRRKAVECVTRGRHCGCSGGFHVHQ